MIEARNALLGPDRYNRQEILYETSAAVVAAAAL
jgi:hypothetical protein